MGFGIGRQAELVLKLLGPCKVSNLDYDDYVGLKPERRSNVATDGDFGRRASSEF